MKDHILHSLSIYFREDNALILQRNPNVQGGNQVKVCSTFKTLNN